MGNRTRSKSTGLFPKSWVGRREARCVEDEGRSRSFWEDHFYPRSSIEDGQVLGGGPHGEPCSPLDGRRRFPVIGIVPVT